MTCGPKSVSSARPAGGLPLVHQPLPRLTGMWAAALQSSSSSPDSYELSVSLTSLPPPVPQGCCFYTPVAVL